MSAGKIAFDDRPLQRYNANDIFSKPVHENLGQLHTTNFRFPWSTSTRGRPRRGMIRRAVFSDHQRKGLEKRFLIQKYISKPDRKKLAEKLGLKDSQVRNNYVMEIILSFI